MNRITKAVPVALLLGTLFAAGARAQSTYTAADCSRNSVNAVINGPTHTAVDGDTITVPAGTCAWTSGITVPSGVGISIIGAGTPNGGASTTGASASCSATVITDNSNSSIFRLRPTATSSSSRISCMKIRTDNAAAITAPFAAAGTCNSSTCPNLRIDNVTFDNSLQGMTADSGSLNLTDNMFGVIDHNTVSPGVINAVGMEFITYNNSAWKGVGAYGDNSWASPDSFGTSQMLYLENNSWGTGVVIGETEAGVPNGGQGGGRIAARFNTCNGCLSGMSNHGTDSNGRPRGGRQIEFYGNSLICTNTGSGCQGGVPIRSGINLMFGNSLTIGSGSWWNQYMALNAFRVNVIWAPPWNQCNGSGPYDDNSSSPPICIDQPGRSGGTLLSGSTPTPTGWVNEVIDPSYEWNDSGYNPVFGNVSSDYSQIAVNRDWYSDNSLGTPRPQTSPTSPFNGTPSGLIGMGFGTLARRPTSCTPRVGYWATDQGNWNTSSNSFGQGQLYVCTATNTWTLYYTPYTYPHPLTGTVTATAPDPPTSLQATAH